MASAVLALDHALSMHEQWSQSVICALICRLQPDERDTSANPHRRCPFGQWYYGQGSVSLGRHPGFVAIEPEHEEMHRIAAHMLDTSQKGLPIPVQDYETFVNAMNRMRTEIQGLRQEIEEGMTDLDPLTGATGRASMLTKLRTQHEMVKRDLHQCTIAMVDLDHFKGVNDAYGHQAGDSVLIETVHHLLAHLRPYDELFRYGGEEFLLCAPGMSLEQGHDAMERLREGIAAIRFKLGDGLVLGLTVSFGITLLDPAAPVEESIARADQAMYQAKAAGRNQTCIWEPALGRGSPRLWPR
jgi:diguanylate cyclase (GGDEF)-like protein